jgi:hypothetical protein
MSDWNSDWHNNWFKSQLEIARKQEERNDILKEVLEILTKIFPSQKSATTKPKLQGGDEGYGVNISQKQISSPTDRMKSKVKEIVRQDKTESTTKGDAAIQELFRKVAQLFTPEATKFHLRLQSEMRALAQNPQKQVDLDWLTQTQQTLRNNVELLRELIALEDTFWEQIYKNPRGKEQMLNRNYYQQEAGEQLKLREDMRMQMVLSNEILKKLKELRDRQESQRRQRLQTAKKSGGGEIDQEWHIGPRGGKFYMDKSSGRKIYSRRR